MAEPPQGRLVGKSKPRDEELVNVLGNELAKFNRRLSLIESRIDGVQDHLNLVDNNLIEKHKSVVADVNSLHTDMQDLRSQVHEVSELMKRMVTRLSDFASREDVKVLERYANYWSPLNFVTKDEVGKMIDENLGRLPSGEVDKEQVAQLVKQHIPEKTESFSKDDVAKMISAEVGKVKPSKPVTASGVTKEEVAALIQEALKKIPKAKVSGKGGGLTEADVLKITKKQIEDLFGKL